MQLPIEWLPTQRQMVQVERKRGSTAQRILARLREAPATSYELAQITHRFSARLLELRKAGHSISREDRVDDGQEWSIYTLQRNGSDYENETPLGQQLMDGTDYPGDCEEI